jgi:hypothetical protein
MKIISIIDLIQDCILEHYGTQGLDLYIDHINKIYDMKPIIINLIDEMIEENLEYAPNDYNNGYWASLTELKEKIEAMK